MKSEPLSTTSQEERHDHREHTTFDAPTAILDDISGDYTLDPSHSRLGFVARHAMVTKVRGEFADFSGTAHIDDRRPRQLVGQR